MGAGRPVDRLRPVPRRARRTQGRAARGPPVRLVVGLLESTPEGEEGMQGTGRTVAG